MAFIDFSMSVPGLAQIARRPAVRLSALEWSAVAVARNDHLSTLRDPSRLSRALAWLFDVTKPRARLANDHLEALRRAAVLAWHGADTLPADEEALFFAAGFERPHFNLVRASVAAARSLPA